VAYHDRSDAGLLTTLAEMALAGHCGRKCNKKLDVARGLPRPIWLAVLFNERNWVPVIQVRR